MKKEKVCVGDTIIVDVCQPKFGKFPVGRFQGIICKLTYPDHIKRLEYGCVIKATVLVIKDRSLVVLVEEVTKSAAAANAELSTSIASLASKWSKPSNHTKKQVSLVRTL